jgi:hypothetical protein
MTHISSGVFCVADVGPTKAETSEEKILVKFGAALWIHTDLMRYRGAPRKPQSRPRKMTFGGRPQTL